MHPLNSDEQTRKTLERRANSQTEPYKAVFLARIILGCMGWSRRHGSLACR
jgi:hypothetical protein